MIGYSIGLNKADREHLYDIHIILPMGHVAQEETATMITCLFFHGDVLADKNHIDLSLCDKALRSNK